MSNHPNNREQDVTLDFAGNKSNPGAAKPEEFPVRHYDDPISQPFHGQCGQSEAEYQRLLRESNSIGAVTPTRNDVNDANQKRGQKAAIGRN
jgi:hypothetical protein